MGTTSLLKESRVTSDPLFALLTAIVLKAHEDIIEPNLCSSQGERERVRADAQEFLAWARVEFGYREIPTHYKRTECNRAGARFR